MSITKALEEIDNEIDLKLNVDTFDLDLHNKGLNEYAEEFLNESMDYINDQKRNLNMKPNNKEGSLEDLVNKI